jgi:hypothetical protein
MTEQKPPWITVAEAVEVTRKSKATIYRILAGTADAPGGVRRRRGSDGVIRMRGDDILRAAGARRPGRPRHRPSHNRRADMTKYTNQPDRTQEES